MHNRLLTFECFHQIKLKAHSIDNNSALESEPNSNNRIWALFQFQNHAKKSTSAKLQLQLLSKLQLQNLEFTSSSSNSCWKPRFLLTNIISIDQVLGNHPYQQESHNSSLNNRTQWVSELVTRVYRNDWTWSDKDEDIWLILVNFARSSHIKSQFRGWMQIFGIPSKVNSEYWRICWSKKIYEDEDINKSQSDDCDECVDQDEDDDDDHEADDHEADDDANGKAMNGARTKAEWVRADTHTLFSAFNPDCDDRSWSSEPPDQSWWSFSPWIIIRVTMLLRMAMNCVHVIV